MAVGDCQRGFALVAAQDGIELHSVYVRVALQGDVPVLLAASANLLLPIDLVHEPTGTLIELDDAAHFTSFRLAALALYPPGVALGFELAEHEELCRAWSSKTDTWGRALAAKGFGMGAIQRQRS